MTRRKSKISKLSKFTRRKANTLSSLAKLHTIFFEDPQNDKRKIETSKLQNTKTKNSKNPQEQIPSPLTPKIIIKGHQKDEKKN
jgi:hypothetical protein